MLCAVFVCIIFFLSVSSAAHRKKSTQGKERYADRPSLSISSNEKYILCTFNCGCLINKWKKNRYNLLNAVKSEMATHFRGSWKSVSATANEKKTNNKHINIKQQQNMPFSLWFALTLYLFLSRTLLDGKTIEMDFVLYVWIVCGVALFPCFLLSIVGKAGKAECYYFVACASARNEIKIEMEWENSKKHMYHYFRFVW